MKRSEHIYKPISVPKRPKPSKKKKTPLQSIEEDRSYYSFDDPYQDLLNAQIQAQMINSKLLDRIDERNKRVSRLKPIPEEKTKLIFGDRTDSRLKKHLSPSWPLETQFLQNLENSNQKVPHLTRKERKKNQ